MNTSKAQITLKFVLSKLKRKKMIFNSEKKFIILLKLGRKAFTVQAKSQYFLINITFNIQQKKTI